MNILALQSSGDQTSISVMLNMEIISFNFSHERKDRPNWNMFLKNVGLGETFVLEDIDLFAYSNCQSSYTATRTIASFLKGVSVALNKPLIVIDDKNEKYFDSSEIVKIAKEKYIESGNKSDLFNPASENPTYVNEANYKKINE